MLNGTDIAVEGWMNTLRLVRKLGVRVGVKRVDILPILVPFVSGVVIVIRLGGLRKFGLFNPIVDRRKISLYYLSI